MSWILIANINVQIMVCQKINFCLRALISCTKWIRISSLHGIFSVLADTDSLISDVILHQFFGL
jgi:hypothetical protein